MDTFASRLSEALTVRKVKAADLAKHLGIGNAAISNYRKGLYEPLEPRFSQIADFLNVNKDWLKGFDVPMSDDEEDDLFSLVTPEFDAYEDKFSPEELLFITNYRKCNERDKAIIDLIINSYLFK